MISLLAVLLAVVTTPYAPVSYACNGSTAAFTVNFPYQAQTDLAVTTTTPAGVATTLTISTDYSLSVTSTSSTATLTLTSPSVKCPSGNTLTIARSTALTQPTGFRQQTSFNPSTVETAVDRLALQNQETSNKIVNPVLPSALTNATPLTARGGVSAIQLQDWLGPSAATYNVKSYGAKGDNSTDDAAAVNLALATASAAGGGEVYFPAGTYLLSCDLTPASNTRIRGSGPGVTVLKVTGIFPCNTAIKIFGTLGSNFAINAPTEGLTTVTTTAAGDAGNFSAGQDIAVSGALFSGDFGPFFITKVVSAVAGTGVITLADSLHRSDFTMVQQLTVLPRNIVISDLTVSQAGDTGWITKYARDITVRNVTVDTGGTSCAEIVGSRNIIMDGSTCANSNSIGALTINSTTDFKIINNSFRSTLASTAIGVENSAERGLISGNIITDAAGNGISLSGGAGAAGSQRIVVSGNIVSNLAANKTALNIGGPGNQNVATGNVVTCASGSGTIGINIGGVTDVITGNNIGPTCSICINIASGAFTTFIQGNSCDNGSINMGGASNVNNSGSSSLTSGTPSTKAITVPKNCRCFVQNTLTPANALRCFVSGTTLTVQGPNTITDTFNYQCVN